MLEDVWQQTTCVGGKTGCTGIQSLSREHQKKVIENVESLDYYHYRLHRTDVEGLVRTDGDFVLREGTRNDPEGYTISVRWGGRMMHFPIHWINGECCFESRSFSLIQNLVHHHYSTGEPVTAKSGAVLMKARCRQTWELLESSIEMGRKLGMGAFGSVYQGTWTRHDGISVIAALKTLDTVSTTEDEGNVLERARTDMLREARTMRELSGHPNLIRAFGVTIDRELPYAVMEFINGGSLDQRLRKSGQHLSVKTKLKVCLEVSRGLCYINRSGYIHRDIAARNCLYEALANDDVGSVKITDFGMAQKLDESGSFKGPQDENVPIVWTSFEGLIDGRWYLKSDVWAIGVIMWEIFSDGCKPYSDVLEALDKVTVAKYLREGHRLKPSSDMHMPIGLQRLMCECMFTNVQMRPPITHVVGRIQDELYAAMKS